MPVDTLDLKRRLEAAITDRASVDATWTEVERWVGPLSGGLPANRATISEGSVDRERAEIWDSTAPDGADKLAAHLSSSITNPAVRWAKMVWKPKRLQESTEANKWLEEATDRIFSELQESDFYREIGSFYGDWVRYCTACFVAEPLKDALTKEDWRGLDFSAPPIRECYYEPDYHWNVLRWWRVFSWTPGQIISKFGTENVPERVRQLSVSPDQNMTRLRVAYAIWVREEQMGKPKEFPAAPELRPVGCVYFLCDSGEQLGDEDGHYEMPVYVVPWEKAAGSNWGHGPGIRVLPDVRYLNERLKQIRVAGEKACDPAFAVTERGQLSDLDIRPGQRTIVSDIDAIKVLESGSKFQVGEHDIADLRAQIRARFWTDELTLKLSPQMTATEVNARLDMMQKLFGPTLSRLQATALNPLWQLVFAMLYRAGKLPQMPAIVRQEVVDSGGEFEIDYQGPLSRAQRMDEVAAVERLASAAAGLIKLGFQEVATTFDPDAALREMAKRLGTPATILRSQDDVKKRLEEQRKLQAQAAQAELARAQADANAKNAQAAAVQSTPAQPVPLVTPEAGGGLM